MAETYSLYQLPINTDLIITFKMESKTFEFPTKVLQNEKTFLIKALKFDKGVLNLEKTDATIDIIYQKQDSRPIVFKNIQIKMDKYKKDIAYNIISDAVGKEFNRRGAVRIFVGASGSMNYEGHPTATNINVKNISQTGISFASEEKIDCLNKKIFITFFDGSFGTIKLRAFVVREETLSNGKHIYGCTLAKEYAIVKDYIMQKQLKQLKK